MINGSFILIALLLFVLELAFIRIARQFKIVDTPNSRSSHNNVAIRGGGVIFPIAMLLTACFYGFEFPFFFAGLIFISLVSFYDDVNPLSSVIRLISHLLAVSLIFHELGFWNYAIWTVLLLYIMSIGILNAYNFMDGINGMIGGYSLITFLSLYLIDELFVDFISAHWLIGAVISILVFNCFNFRRNAKCFAGDVGSVSMAYIVVFFLILLIFKAQDLKYIGLLIIYGADTVTTICFRLVRKENIFEAHRSHFYQYLANVKKWSHIRIAGIYMLLQVLVNALIVFGEFSSLQYIGLLAFIGMGFIFLRFKMEGKEYLLSKAN